MFENTLFKNKTKENKETGVLECVKTHRSMDTLQHQSHQMP